MMAKIFATRHVSNEVWYQIQKIFLMIRPSVEANRNSETDFTYRK